MNQTFSGHQTVCWLIETRMFLIATVFNSHHWGIFRSWALEVYIIKLLKLLCSDIKGSSSNHQFYELFTQWPIYLIKSVNKTKLSCNTLPSWRSTTVSYETYSLCKHIPCHLVWLFLSLEQTKILNCFNISMVQAVIQHCIYTQNNNWWSKSKVWYLLEFKVA